MTPTTRKKAKRHLLSACLSGVFTEREISELSHALMSDKEFTSDLGCSLQKLANQLSGGDSPGRHVETSGRNTYSEITKDLTRRISELGITQRELLSLMHEVSPEVAVSLEGKRLPTIELIDRFVRDQNAEQIRGLINLLLKRPEKRSSGHDPYLDIISKKLED